MFFALMVTLTPTLGLGWLFYTQTKKLLLGKAAFELHSIIDQAHRETALWLKESVYSLKVFSNSYVLSENLERVINTKQSGNSLSAEISPAPLKTITEYLALVQSQFHEYQRLLVLDSKGAVKVQYPESKADFSLPVDWKEQLEKNKMIIGETNSSDLSIEATFLLAVPVLSNGQSFLGILAAEMTINELNSVIKSITISRSAHISLQRKNGSLLSSSRQAQKSDTTPASATLDPERMNNRSNELSIYKNANGSKVVGLSSPLPLLPWNIAMEKDYQQAFREVLELKNITLAILAILLSVVAVAAFLLSHSILSPLKQLINGAPRVADGDLDVQLEVRRHDEIGFTMSIFNDMVIRLRKNHEKLEKLSAVDALTGLFNRKRLMEMFALHIKRYARHQTPFSVLMVDLDHFKEINDRYGHLAGDAVLVSIGELLREMLRSIDTAGRYGGEEFLIILDDIREQEALHTAERIRMAVENNEVIADGKTIRVSISIGVATISNIFDMEKGRLINRADKALYEAKRNGRNCVVLSRSMGTDQLQT
ncbi:MAG TPA: diguanylate cyclase [Desulfocapsa sulfexigens]|nr:diguanylate cyclase [Desulfocapsa sulfexigens]